MVARRLRRRRRRRSGVLEKEDICRIGCVKRNHAILMAVDDEIKSIFSFLSSYAGCDVQLLRR